MWIDLPRDGATVRQPFAIAGWAIDHAASTDNGMDLVHVWAYPDTGAAPIFLGAAQVNAPRPDLGAAFGSLHATGGYGLIARGLAPGTYTIAVFAHSTLVPAFTIAQPTRVQVVESAQVVPRPDVGAFFGAQFGVSGFNLLAPPLPAGAYRVVAFGRSLVTGTFSAVAVAEVRVR